MYKKLSSGEGSEENVYFWNIVNFFMWSRHHILRSPTFTSESLHNSQFQLQIQQNRDGIIACSLRRSAEDGGPDEMCIGFRISILRADGGNYKLFRECRYRCKRSSYLTHEAFAVFAELLDPVNRVMRNDGLTLKLCVWRNPLIDTSLQSMSYTEEYYKFFTRLIYLVHSRTPNSRNQVDNEVKPYLSREGLRHFVVVSLYYYEDYTPEECVKCELMCNTENVPLFCNFKVSLLDAERIPRLTLEQSYTFKSDLERYDFPDFINVSKVMAEKEKYLLENKLYVEFDCEFRYNATANTQRGRRKEPIVGHEIVLNPPIIRAALKKHGLRSDLHSLYMRKKFADIKLIADGDTFQAHKAVLCARSPVFSAMFERNTCEKDCNEVNIEDVDAGTLGDLLSFLYTETLREDLEPEEAIRLYSAADKYEILSLKRKCRIFLSQSFVFHKPFEILVLSDLHDDEYLKSAALNVISGNISEVLLRDELVDFKLNHPQLAEEVFDWLRKDNKRRRLHAAIQV